MRHNTTTRVHLTAIGSIAFLALLTLAACGGTASTTPASPSAPPAPPAQIHTAQVTVNGQTETVLTDTRGFTLYYFTPDTSTTVACTAGCAQAWPPLIATSNTPTANAPLSATFGVLNGADGKQVTCNGHPLYTFAGDKAPGQTNGQDFNGIWFVATPGVAALVDSSSAAVHTARVTIGGAPTTVLTAPSGLTLYYFTPDTATHIACTGDCANAWPPLIAKPATPASDHGLPGKLAVLNGANGLQITYNGHPLYTFAGDKAPGDTKGQGLFGKWFVAKPDLTVLS